MRVFLFLFLLLISDVAIANKTDCDMITDMNTCENTAGCHRVSTECLNCAGTYFCPGYNNEQNLCSEAGNGTFDLSDEGAESSAACYKNINCLSTENSSESCRHYIRNIISCPTITGAHIEPDNVCYAETRLCDLFTTENCPQNQISGTAHYVAAYGHNPGHWAINQCQCGATEFEDTNTRFCQVTQSGATPSTTTIYYATSTINYDNFESYYCTRCILDNGNTKYYANIDYTDGDHCTPDTAQGHVCKCETSNDKGFYRTGTCNSNDNWTSSNNICRRSQCDPGQTTSTILPEGIDNCHYGSETKLCDDGGGCIELENIYQNVSGFNNSSFDILKWKPF